MLVLIAFVVLGLGSSVPSQQICWEERLPEMTCSVLIGT